jgi:hypothetical protein
MSSAAVWRAGYKQNAALGPTRATELHDVNHAQCMFITAATRLMRNT